MSTITNEPILLDSTGRAMLERFDRTNALLSLLTASDKQEAYTSIAQVASIIRQNTVEENRRLFPEGDQILIKWKDMDDNNHNTDETAYTVPLNIVHHDMVELQSGVHVPGVFLQWHYTTPYGVQFSHQQAFLKCPEGLNAGQYYITFGVTWGNAVQGESWNFTLTQPVPAGGLLSGFEYLADSGTPTTSWRVKSWASQASLTPIETVNVASGAEGTSLGTMERILQSEEGLNGMQRVGYGHNMWTHSAIRKYLNGSGTSWWTPTEDFEVRPDQYAKHGFLDGFDADFLAETKPIKVVTALNTVEGLTEATETTYDRFFLPSLEQMFITPQLSGVEGTAWKYWQNRLGLTNKAAHHPTIYPSTIHTVIDNQATPQHVRLRSAYRGGSCNTWRVSSTGYVGSYDACGAHRFSPVCVIC